VLQVTPNLLVLEERWQRRDDEHFWEKLGRLRQDNTWDHDGHSFFAQRRSLRWLPEPLVAEAFDAPERQALERLCERLPELIPARPAAPFRRSG
jgi:fructosamine-3-kinase